MPLKPQEPKEIAYIPVGDGNGTVKQVEVLRKDRTASGIGFIVGRERREDKDQIEAHIQPAERHRLSAPQIEGFQRAARQVQGLLDGERVEEAVDVLKGGE